MEENSRGRMLIAAVAIFLFIICGAGVYKGWMWLSSERTRLATTDSAEIKLPIKIEIDDYAGYLIWTSADMRSQAASRGMGLDFHMEPDYQKRIAKLKAGEVDLIFIPISEYMKYPDQYNGAAIQAIAGSKGADAIYAFKKNLPNGKVSDLNDPTLKWVYVRGSVSETLIDATIQTLELSGLARSSGWRVPVDTIEEVYARAKNRQGDVFVFWEPMAGKALKEIPELTYVWGSDKFQGYIKDVVIGRSDFVAKHGEELIQLLEAYFVAMRGYENDPDRMIAEFVKSSPVPTDAETIKRTIAKIDFYDLRENAALEFGIPFEGNNNPSRGLEYTIGDCVGLFKRTGIFSSDPLKGNYGQLTNKKLLMEVVKRMPMSSGGNTVVKFSELTEEEWRELTPAGTLRLEPIPFEQNQDVLTPAGAAEVDRLAQEINHFPTHRLAVRGHTSLGSDEAESVKLSLDRAKAVIQRLTGVHNIDPKRLHAEGLGFNERPTRRPGESEREFRGRWPRVEFVLLEKKSSL